MLHIILAILKIVGILLAVLLLLVLLVVCSVLFVPLRYRVSAAKDAEGIRAQGRVSWLLRAVSATVEYRDGRPALKVRVLFLKKNILTGEEQPSKEKKKKKKNSLKKKAPQKEEKLPAPGLQAEDRLQSKEISEESMESPAEKSPKEPDFEKSSGENSEKEKGKPAKLFDSVKRFWKKLTEIPQKLRQLAESGKAAFEKISDWVSFLFSDTVKAVIHHFKEHLLYLWRHLKPDRIQGELWYGFDDPSLTGQLTGLFYMLLPVGRYEIRLQPDFENTLYEGELHIKGHIRICHLARVGWKVFRDKEFRKILKKFQA